MQECQHKQSLCGCIDWKKDDLAVQVNHLMNHFEFTGFELEYTTLEQSENRRLCKIGRCRLCGKRLCIGTGLPSQDAPDKLLMEIYRWTFQLWMAPGERLPNGADCFQDMFVSLFHETDREVVYDWLERHAENPSGEDT